MASKRLRDVLDRVRWFTATLIERYEDLGESALDRRTRALVEYMARHEQQLNAGLKAYEDDTAERILDTWLQFVPDENLEAVFADLDLRPDLSVDEVVERAMTFDRALIELYRALAETTEVPEIRDLFTSLTAMEDGKDRQYSKALLEFLGED